MKKLFYPDSVAVVGLSANALNLAGLIAYNLKEWGYKGKVYGVNPGTGGKVHGAKIYPSLADVPGPVDLVVALAPARTVPELFDQCGEKGVKYVVIETAGFSEFSEEGRALGDEIRRKASEYGIRFVGPNCVGMINAENGLSLPFTHIEPWEAGRVSVLSQSGGVGLNTLMWLGEYNVASNKFVSMGNKYDLDEVDYLEYLIGDEGTDVVLLFLESLVRGREFAEVAARSEKPILVYKAGMTEAGLRRARSHTAALANDDDVLDAALRQAGVIRVDEIQKLAMYARMFSQPRMRGRRVAVISQAGGYTVIAADHAERAGFAFPSLSKETREEIEGRLRAGVIRLSNPLDLGDAFDSDTMLLAIEKSLQDRKVDGVVVIQPRRPMKLYQGAFEVMMRNIVPEAEALVGKYGKPMVIGVLGTPEVTTHCRGDSSLPVYKTPLEAVEALAMYRDFCTGKKWKPPRGGRALKREAAVGRALRSEGVLQGVEALELLKKVGVRAPRMKRARTWKEAREAVGKMRFPVVAKAISPGLAHKTERRGVRLGLRNVKELKAAFDDLIVLAGPGGGYVMLQEMVEGGVEVIVGGRCDPHFGPVVLFGTGGVMVELFRDAAMRLAPLNRREARELVREPRGYRLLTGFRGAPKADVGALVGAVEKVSRFLYVFPEVKELDINPLMVLPDGKGCLAVDARCWIEKLGSKV